MAKVSPPGDRASVEDHPEGLVVSIPVRKNWFVLLFLPLWLCGWLMGEASAIREIATGGAQAAFLAVWLTLWTVGGAFAIVVFLWTLAGVQRLLFSSAAIKVHRGAFGIGFTREYDLAHARNLRVSADAWNIFDFRSSFRFWGLTGGPMAFDYGSSTIRIATGIEEAEASRLVQQVLARFPGLRGA